MAVTSGISYACYTSICKCYGPHSCSRFYSHVSPCFLYSHVASRSRKNLLCHAFLIQRSRKIWQFAQALASSELSRHLNEFHWENVSWRKKRKFWRRGVYDSAKTHGSSSSSPEYPKIFPVLVWLCNWDVSQKLRGVTETASIGVRHTQWTEATSWHHVFIFPMHIHAALLMYISQKNMVSCWIFLGFYLPHIIHVWYTYLHMVDSFLWLNHVRIHTTTVVPWWPMRHGYQVLQTHRIDPRFRQAFAPGPFPKAEGGPSQWRGRRGRWSRWWGAQRGGSSPGIGGRKVISLLGRCGSFFWMSIPDKKKCGLFTYISGS